LFWVFSVAGCTPNWVPFAGRLATVLERRQQEPWPGCPWVFHHRGKRVDPRRLYRAWDAAAAVLGLQRTGTSGARPFYVHDLRRSAARILRRAGVNQVTIMERGGWKTGKMFMRYAITDDRDQREAQQAIDAALAAPRRPTCVP